MDNWRACANSRRQGSMPCIGFGWGDVTLLDLFISINKLREQLQALVAITSWFDNGVYS